MTPPTYREIVLAFGGLVALVGRMMDRGGVRLTLTIECDEADYARAMALMKLDPDKGSRKMMGVTISWRAKQ